MKTSLLLDAFRTRMRGKSPEREDGAAGKAQPFRTSGGIAAATAFFPTRDDGLKEAVLRRD